MDPLSEVLSLVKLETFVTGGFVVKGGIGLQSQRYKGLKCYAAIAGSCWLEVEGIEAPIQLMAGDCIVLPRGWPICLATDLSSPRADFQSVVAAQGREGTTLSDDETGCSLVGGQFLLRSDFSDSLLHTLPPIVHIRSAATKGVMRWSLEYLREELRDPQPGGMLVAQQLSYVLLLHALRHHLSETVNGTGWLFALVHPQMKAAIAAMHGFPARAWTIQDLASCAGMSRTVFAQHFKAKVGVTSMEYLTRWRMMLACDRLRSSAEPVGVIARAVGYEAEGAFGKAFKRVIGCTPKAFRNGEHRQIAA
ncbi:MAG TPA: AraC family transcriptional regulator [Candidatus Sulfotelmatobacter sp.]|jgi:AraC-like DNA-binding protein|nr:AraC family transcriptional regulator [Candidatus Sulfotelmatobacter sp.]